MTNPLGGLHPTLAHNLVSTLGWTTLRPLQREAIEPVMRGDDTLLLAPTAGGKTEAAIFPMLTRMSAEGWTGLSVLYLCPLKALLNNLLPRLELYGGWTGRRVALWHGDTSASQRKSILTGPPDLLLTTPESLESMLVSANVDHRRLFAGLQAVIVDEVHAFGSGDRGWHLLAVLERLSKVAGRPLQRIGLSATVGNPGELLKWLQGSSAGVRDGVVVGSRDYPFGIKEVDCDLQLDYVGSVANAATVIAALHRGEKRLVFADSKRLVEMLGAELRARGVTTYLVHASLSLDERRRAEEAFAAGRDCVIVSTSALELGIDVGDLDRVIQINSPVTVAAFLQRLGRSGRRAGTVRNCLFLALDEEQFLLAAGLLLAWERGFIEPVAAPPEPRHIVAQQILALCLQEGRVGENLWQEWLPVPSLLTSAAPITEYLIAQGFVEREDGMLFIGPSAEAKFGRRHFMGLMAVFTAPPEFTVLHGREEIGRTDPVLLADRVDGPRLLLLGGRSWRVTWTDWNRRRCFVEPAPGGGGRARWLSSAVGGLSFEVAWAMRDVLLGADPPAVLTRRASGILAGLRSDGIGRVAEPGTVVAGGDGDLRWWTWAGYRANATLKATLGEIADPAARVSDLFIRLRGDLRASTWPSVRGLADHLVLPEVDEKALAGLKFSEALPRHLANATLARRLADLDHARDLLGERVRFERRLL
ncbi:MAG: DEAD/DEAH box helicase [Nocardiopsaceae bacterium]|nr:DEAD/DEAH box helicase [Nocardiopsaceae bacterium]